jgi:hypothetical protein
MVRDFGLCFVFLTEDFVDTKKKYISFLRPTSLSSSAYRFSMRLKMKHLFLGLLTYFFVIAGHGSRAA